MHTMSRLIMLIFINSKITRDYAYLSRLQSTDISPEYSYPLYYMYDFLCQMIVRHWQRNAQAGKGILKLVFLFHGVTHI